jgi:hypothetical protein
MMHEEKRRKKERKSMWQHNYCAVKMRCTFFLFLTTFFLTSPPLWRIKKENRKNKKESA